jgi:hypothetical protein
MNNELGHHLNTETLNDLMIGLGSAEAEDHLAACAECRARIGQFQKDVALLDQTSMAWSRLRAAHMPDPPIQAGVRRLPLATMGWAMVVVLLLAIAPPVWRTLNRPTASQMPSPTVQTETSEAQIAEDNQLLHDVDTAINTGEAAPLEEFTRPDRPHPHQKARP